MIHCFLPCPSLNLMQCLRYKILLPGLFAEICNRGGKKDFQAYWVCDSSNLDPRYTWVTYFGLPLYLFSTTIEVPMPSSATAPGLASKKENQCLSRHRHRNLVLPFRICWWKSLSKTNIFSTSSSDIMHLQDCKIEHLEISLFE